MNQPEILVVDDDPQACDYLALLLRREGYGVKTASNGLEAVLAVEAAVPDLVVSDLKMPVMDGFELLIHVKARWPGLPVIIVSVVEEIATIVEAVQRGAANYVLKPASPQTLLAAVRKGLNTRVKRTPHSGPIAEILGASRTMVDVRRLVALAASSDVNVLITGETGTGKELVARAIHRCSGLSGGPFVAHNCAATPSELFESQFFGHRRGSFTGSLEDHVGLLVEADGGVLLLDELEALSPQNQAKFLRVVDDGEVRPLGSTEVRCVSVRFLAATNRDPLSMVDHGTLREDLYYRLRGLEISISPLRERREDIPLLAQHFLGPRGGTFTLEAMEALCSYRWPGNVRELRNVVRAAKAVAEEAPIAPSHLSFNGMSGGSPAVSSTPAGPDGIVPLREVERGAILEALKIRHGNLSRTARDLGIDRSTLRRKMRELGKGRGLLEKLDS